MGEIAEPVIQITLRALIFPFITLAGYFVAWGLIFCMDAVVRSFFGRATGLTAHIPIIGRTVSGGLHVIEHSLTSYLGGMEQQFENQMATRWHRFAGLMEQRNDNAMRGAVIVYHAVAKLNTLWGNWATGGLMKDTHKVARHAGAQAAAATKTAQHAAGVAHAGYQATSPAQTQTIPHTQVIVRTYPAGRLGTRTSALEGELGRVIDWDIPRLRARTKAIEHGLSRLNKWIRTHPLVIPEAVAVAAVATALGRLGGSWIRCKNWNRIGRAVCGLPLHLIEELLAGAIVTFAVLDICDFAAAAQRAAQAFVPELMALVDVENALLGCHGASAAPPLTLPPLHLPPTNLGLQLAA